MKKADSMAMMSLVDKLTELMTDYEKKTDRMITGDLEIIQQVLMDRNVVIDDMKAVKARIVDLIEMQNQQDKELLKAMMNNKPVSSEMTNDQKQILLKIKRLHAIKLSIESKDRKITTYVQQRFDDVKAELASLQVDKKRIDYYSAVKVGGKGRSFDSKL